METPFAPTQAEPPIIVEIALWPRENRLTGSLQRTGEQAVRNVLRGLGFSKERARELVDAAGWIGDENGWRLQVRAEL